MTYMYQEVTESKFHDAFVAYGRGDQFSYAARTGLYNYLMQLADESDTPIELDVIGLCCDFTEYETVGEFNQATDNEYTTWEDVEDAIWHESADGPGLTISY